jgi:REP element-mobilizing transposase RayT
MKNTSKKYTSGAPAHAYLLTIRAYASWLHGDERGSVDPKHNQYNTPTLPSSPSLEKAMRSFSTEIPFKMCQNYRDTVLQSVIETCHYNHWHLYAVHVRTEHIHLVVQSNMTKEKTTGKIKCYATKFLKQSHSELLQRKNFWSRHASTKNIWAPEAIFPALYYVVKRQGEPMALYYDKQYYSNFDEQLYECYLDDAGE